MTSVDHSQEPPQDEVEVPVCTICAQGSHRFDQVMASWFHQCPKLLKSKKEEKHEYARKCGLCFKCFRRGHLARDCKVKKVDNKMVVKKRPVPL